MPLSKKRDKERKRRARLERLMSPPQFQPKREEIKALDAITKGVEGIDADGNPIYQEG